MHSQNSMVWTDELLTCDFTSFQQSFSHIRTMMGSRLCPIKPRLRLERFPPPAELEPGTDRSLLNYRVPNSVITVCLGDD